MKRIIEKYYDQFVIDGKRVSAYAIGVPLEEVPEDCDFEGCNVSIYNILNGEDCQIHVTNFDDNSNRLLIKPTPLMQRFLALAHCQGIEVAAELTRKLSYESQCLKNNKKIGYDNTVV